MVDSSEEDVAEFGTRSQIQSSKGNRIKKQVIYSLTVAHSNTICHDLRLLFMPGQYELNEGRILGSSGRQ
jgi:hypothetical protein